MFGFVCQTFNVKGTFDKDPRVLPPPSMMPPMMAVNLYPISLFFFFFFFSSFGLVLCWFGTCSIYGLGLKGGLGMVICKFVGIFLFRICLKMALIW